MEIPTFKEKIIPVKEMAEYLDGKSENYKYFENLHNAVKIYGASLIAENIASLVDYLDKVEWEIYLIMESMGVNLNGERCDSLIQKFYTIDLDDFKDFPVAIVQYYAVKQLVEEYNKIKELLNN